MIPGGVVIEVKSVTRRERYGELKE
ncbi:hypothetical protein A2U01_0084913, partial [Trifolium medium]|nr:hypothetical protein [Trifolium medium]